MASDDLIETKNALKQQLNSLKGQCEESYLSTVNNRLHELKKITSENSKERTLCYVDGLRAGLEVSETPVNLDKNLVLIQFMEEMKKRISDTHELIAYNRGIILDYDTEILR